MPPQAAYKPVKRKCPICDKVFKDKASLVAHINRVHSDSIPDDYSASRYENYLRTNMTHGNCIECKQPTSWNESTWKYNRLCDNPKCRQATANKAKKNMVSKYGKEHLLNDPDMQRKMIYSKRNSGTYYWSTDDDKKYHIMYASSEEKKFLEMLDAFLNMEPNDVMGPSPNTYAYKFDGEQHFYIPDYYIPSINLEIEIKEPKDNQNMHPKIQAVDKKKEDIKDKMMKTHREVNYIKINGNDYRDFFALVMQLKEKDSPYKMSDMYNDIHESFDPDILSEIEGLTEKMEMPDSIANLSDNIKIIDSLNNPKLSYNDDIKKFHKMISRARTNSELDIIEGLLNNYELKLNNMIKDVNRQSKFESRDRENEYNAKKALEKTPALHKEIIKRRKIVTECTVFMEDVNIDYNTFYEESTTLKGYNEKIQEWFKPVFVVLSYTFSPMGKAIKKVTHSTYTHAGLTFNSDMTDIMSFEITTARKPEGGFTYDRSFYSGGYAHEGSYYAIYMYLAPQHEYDIMQEFVQNIKDNEEAYDYSVKGLINYLVGRNKRYSDEYFCSEFVASVLQQGNPKVIKKSANRYSPQDLTNVRNLKLMDKGLIVNYNSHRLDKAVKKVMEDRNLVSITIR